MEFRNWCFTINNETKEDVEECLALNYKYLLIGIEVGEECKTPHLQCYVNLKRAASFDKMKKSLTRARITNCAGEDPAKIFMDNYRYCTKGYAYEGDTPIFYEYGKKPRQGERTDINQVILRIEQGATREQISREFPRQYFMYKNKIDSLVPLTKVKKERKVYLLRESDRYSVSEDAFRAYEFPDPTYEGSKEYVAEQLSIKDMRRVCDWLHNCPPKYKYGYEVKYCDPDVVYLIRIKLQYAQEFFPNIEYICLDAIPKDVQIRPNVDTTGESESS